MAQPIGFKTAGEHVVLDGVNEQLLQFVAVLDRIHQQLFASQLVIVGAHVKAIAPLAAHANGRAVDLRTSDKDAESNLVFLTVLIYASACMHVTVTDNRNMPGYEHIHLEWQGA